METIIKAAVKRGASDIHIKAGDVFRARIDGELQPLTKQRLTPEQTKSIALKLISNEEDRKRIERLRDYDCSWGAPGIGRFRVNILRQRSSFMVVMRVIPFEVPTIDKLHLPRVIENIAGLERGIVFVTGPAGAGKTSTVAALLHLINSSSGRHVVTLESPIEFLHRDLKGSVTQREIGVDTDSFEVGLRAALRQDPDVVYLAEVRNTEMMGLALTAAETGHLVITTLPTSDVTSTVARVAAMFSPEERDLARVRLADSLAAVVSQRLLQRADGSGRLAAVEVLIVTPEARDMIRDRTRVGELCDFMARSREEFGMQVFDQHLADLVESEVVTLEAALAVATSPGELEERFNRGPLASR